MPALLAKPFVIAVLIMALGWVIGFGLLFAMFTLAVKRTPAKNRAAIIRALAELARAMWSWTAATMCIAAVMAVGIAFLGWRQELAGDSTTSWAWIERASWIFGIVSGLLALVTVLRYSANTGTTAKKSGETSAGIEGEPEEARTAGNLVAQAYPEPGGLHVSIVFLNSSTASTQEESIRSIDDKVDQ